MPSDVTAVECSRVHCEDGWTQLGDSCYLVMSGTEDFDGARTRCSDVGADLVTVNSQEEQDLVTQLTQP